MQQHTKTHISSYRKLSIILTMLLALTTITVAVSRFDLGKFNIWIALLIACTKSSLVILFFMHLKYERPLFKFMFLTAVLTLAIFISFIFFDLADRYR